MLHPLLSQVLGGILQLTGTQSSILMNDATLTATCGTNASVRFLNVSSDYDYTTGGGIRAYLAGVPPTCTEASHIGEPCATDNMDYPALFSCDLVPESGTAVSMAKGLRAKIRENLSPSGNALLGIEVFVDCSPATGDVASSVAPKATLRVSYAGAALPFSGLKGADVLSIAISPPALPPPPFSPPPPPPQGKTCKEVKASGAGDSSGWYDVYNSALGTTAKVYCDMTTDGGGWTRVTAATKSTLSSSENSAFRNGNWKAYTEDGIGSFTGSN